VTAAMESLERWWTGGDVGYVLIKNRFDWWERGVRSVSRVLERLFVFL
jgi:hypothetical protein